MLEKDCFPIALGMATDAVLSKPSFMRVIFLVARIAVHWGLVLIELPLMARVALGMNMPPEQRVPCMKGMVKGNGSPISFGMARGTFLSIIPFMFVVLLVAGVTVRRCILEGRCAVTALAFCGSVFPQ